MLLWLVVTILDSINMGHFHSGLEHTSELSVPLRWWGSWALYLPASVLYWLKVAPRVVNSLSLPACLSQELRWSALSPLFCWVPADTKCRVSLIHFLQRPKFSSVSLREVVTWLTLVEVVSYLYKCVGFQPDSPDVSGKSYPVFHSNWYLQVLILWRVLWNKLISYSYPLL